MHDDYLTTAVALIEAERQGNKPGCIWLPVIVSVVLCLIFLPKWISLPWLGLCFLAVIVRKILG